MSSILSFARRSILRSTLALTAVAALAACDTDSPVGPTRVAASAEASMARGSFTTATAYVTWTVEDGMIDVDLATSEFTIDNGTGRLTTIADNSALDLDRRPGKFKAKVGIGAVTVCGKTAPAGYVFYFVPDPAPCKTATTVVGGTTPLLAPFWVYRTPTVYWHAKVAGVYAKGSVYTITSAATGVQVKIADDGAEDMFQNSASVYVTVPATGLYTVCQIVAPKGGQLAEPACRQVNVQSDLPALAGIFDSMPL